MKERHMGLKRPIRGRGSLPPWAMAPKGGAHPPSRTNSPLGGLVPHGKGREAGTPPWPI